MRYQDKVTVVCGGVYGLGTWSMWSSLRPTEVECQKTPFADGMLCIPMGEFYCKGNPWVFIEI